ncbi:ATP synthase F1 subunit epsilon [Fontivita pretiosa]|uniref:ATP synthase F1 subunit epsilon n=1 Tax=Fontivita pretiosa TaxID=2989684 RepID=UPI003D17A246
MAFQCIVVTPEQQVLDEPITQAIVPGHDGKVGILTDRAPLLLKLGLGEMRLDLPNGQKRFYYVEGGVAQMKDNRLTILTQEATPAANIDVESARAELAEAEARRITDQASYEERQRRLARARARIELAQRR